MVQLVMTNIYGICLDVYAVLLGMCLSDKNAQNGAMCQTSNLVYKEIQRYV
jgi:hypothetical protein